MSEEGEASDSENESRTASVGRRQRLNDAVDDELTRISSGASTPRTRVRRGRVGRPDIRDFVPMGGSFSSSGASMPPEQPREVINVSSDEEYSRDQVTNSSQARVEAAIPPKSNSVGYWNKTGGGTLRTSLGQRRVAPVQQASNFNDKATNSMDSKAKPVQAGHRDQVLSTERFARDILIPDAISISDDSSQADPEQNDSAIMLNMRSDSREDSQGSLSVYEPQVALYPDEASVRSRIASETANNTSRPAAEPNGTESTAVDHQKAHDRSEGSVFSAVLGAASEEALLAFSKEYAKLPRTLAELNTEDLDRQLRYALFQIDSKQIDPNGPIHCLNCFERGHLENLCPHKKCEHCGAWAKHDSRFCPEWRKCSKCRERGHDRDGCQSKLVQTLRSCDICASVDHIEDKCDMLWKVRRREVPEGQVSIWLSCSACAGRDHLSGDCPEKRIKPNSTSWTLKDFDPSQIINLTLQAGSGRSDKPLGRRIRGRGVRGTGHEAPLDQNDFDNSDEDNESIFYRPRINAPQRRHIRFDGRNIGRDEGFAPPTEAPRPYSSHRFDDDDRYRPVYRDRDDRGYDRYEDRRRSRSPVRRGGDHWQPPLPPEPPPSSLPLRPTVHQSQRQNKPAAGGRNAGRGGQGTRPQQRIGPKANSNKQPVGGPKGNGKKGQGYQPMPSAGKKAWQKLKT